MRHAVTVAELDRWRDHGATWRLLELTQDHIEVELCTCYGEAVDRVRCTDPEVIAFLRAHPTAG
ncbi:MAG: hypothetical protein QOF83_4142 [Solirubrobacteraceae bacterium]|jgi:hypothetical protein|nr:hypothetical protein [Solirubrobacteraceae bacterium]